MWYYMIILKEKKGYSNEKVMAISSLLCGLEPQVDKIF